MMSHSWPQTRCREPDALLDSRHRRSRLGEYRGLVHQSRASAAQYDAAVDQDGVGAGTVGDTNELVDRVSAGGEFGNRMRTQHDVAALAWLDAADDGIETGGTCPSQRLHFDDVLRYQRTSHLTGQMQCEKAGITRRA